jgi:hypothetical protein
MGLAHQRLQDPTQAEKQSLDCKKTQVGTEQLIVIGY